jgi:hypothetical protein
MQLKNENKCGNKIAYFGIFPKRILSFFSEYQTGLKLKITYIIMYISEWYGPVIGKI